MKLLLLADANSSHIIKWVHALADQNLDILLFSLSKDVDYYDTIRSVKVVTLNHNITRLEGSFRKLKHLRALPLLKNQIQEFQPDILHSHYATSYGLLGALSNFHPYILSVWGSDVFGFPRKSFLHRMLLQFNLSKAEKLLSTSHVMATETTRYTKTPIEVTPFGVDMRIFKHQPVNTIFKSNDIVIGTVKTLEMKYGIEYLVEAFNIVVKRNPSLPLKLLIVGGGSLEKHLKETVKKLSLQNITVFTGNVPYTEVPKYHNMLDISVSVSVTDSESFGVAIIEASACEKPVVVSNAGGLPEVVQNGVTGLIVPPQDSEATADAIEKLVLNKSLRLEMGRAGRQRVRQLYNWKENVQQMVSIYQKVLE